MNDTNDSTFALISKSDKWRSRASLRFVGTKLRCAQHGLQVVLDYQPLAKKVSLECLCIRPLYSSDSQAALDSFAVQKATRPKIFRENSYVRITEVPEVPEAA